jgi:hypothetical protein
VGAARPPTIAIAALVLVLSACAGPAAERSLGVRSDCVADAAEGAGAGRTETPGAFWLFRSVMRTGGEATGDTVIFGRIKDVTVDSTGRIYVADSMRNQILVYDPHGRHLRQIGGSGQGPGEFRDPTRLMSRGDSVWVFDPLAWRMTAFDSVGRTLETITPPQVAQFGQVPEVEILSDGTLMQLGYDRYQEGLESSLGERRSAVVRGPNTIERWSRGESGWQVLAEVPGLEVFVDMDEGGIQDVLHARRALWAPTPDGGFWYADSGESSVARFDREGARVCGIELELSPVPLTRAERDAYYDAADLTDRSPEHVTRARQDRRGVPVPSHHPALERLLVADDGSLWVKRTPPSEATDAEHAEWLVLSPDGAWRATARMPFRFAPRRIVGDRVYGIEQDSLGVHLLAVYQRDAE